MLKVINPETGELLESLAYKTGEEILKMVEAANKAQEEWEAKPLYDRAAILMNFCNMIEANKDELGALMAKEMGKPILEAVGEPEGAAEIGRGYIERAKHLYGEVLSETTPGCENDLIFTRREALGVVAAIIPFNFPVEMVIQKTVASMIMGNAVIVKAPSSNPLTVKRMVEIGHEAGIPEDVMQFMVAERKVATEYLLENPGIHAIALTGSTDTGVEMVKNSAATLKKVFLELGGNDALVIREDADLDYAVEESLGGRIGNNGQICCATKRFIVSSKIKEAYQEKLVAALKEIKIGSALDESAVVTCLVTEAAAAKVEAQVQKTIEQGAKLLYGGERKGAHYPPTVLTDVPKTADIALDMEVFGPVFPIISFDTDAEAVEIANASKYGLSSGVISSDTMKGMAIASKLQASGAVVNGTGGYRHNEQAFGGYKASGIGNEGVSTSLEEYSRIKTYVIKGAFRQEI